MEGPVVTAAAAFAASLHIFNIFAVILLSVLGDVLSDIFYFTLGNLGRERILGKRSFFGIGYSSFKRWDERIDDNLGKSMLLIKITPVLAVPGLIAVGASKTGFGRFVGYSLLISIPKAVFYAFIGYYFGVAFESFSHRFSVGQWFLLIFIEVVIFLSILIYWFLSRYGRKKQGLH